MDETLEGYAWLPRMIDKARGGHDLVHPCPVDRTCMALLRIEPEAFAAIVAGAPDDAAVLAGLREHPPRPSLRHALGRRP